MTRPAGPVALVTGAGGETGRAAASAVAARGGLVVVADADAAAARALAATLGPLAQPHRLDPGDELAWIALLAAVLDRHGRLDLLVHPVPAPPAAADPEQLSLADWRAALQAPLDGLVLGCRHGLRAMRRTRAPGAGAPAGLIVSLVPSSAGAAVRAAVRQHSRWVAQHCAGQRLPIQCRSLPARPAALAAAIDPLYQTR